MVARDGEIDCRRAEGHKGTFRGNVLYLDQKVVYMDVYIC